MRDRREPEDEADIAARIRSSEADVLLVAYGAPKQDKWIARNLERTGVAVAIGIGGSLDFIVGTQKRAPRWMQRVGLEWLYRLIREPWRWRRQLALAADSCGSAASEVALAFASRITHHSVLSFLQHTLTGGQS